MGVPPPEAQVEAFQEEPRTPPGLRGQPAEDNSEDDLFSDTGTTTTTTTKTTSVFNFDHEIDYRNIFPLPAKGVFEDFLGRSDHWNAPNEKKYCGKCFEDVKRDLKKLAEVVDTFRDERDEARKKNEELRKEVEELKKLVKQREEIAVGDVNVNIKNGGQNVDVLVRNNAIEKGNVVLNPDNKSNKVKKFGILSFAINLQKDKSTDKSSAVTIPEVKPKKTIADLRREFFAKEFESEQKTFTTNNYLEIKPEEKKESFRSKLNIRVKSKKKISELISKLTSRVSAPKVIPDSTPITMFQRFEKTRTVWVSDIEEKAFV